MVETGNFSTSDAIALFGHSTQRSGGGLIGAKIAAGGSCNGDSRGIVSGAQKIHAMKDQSGGNVNRGPKTSVFLFLDLYVE